MQVWFVVPCGESKMQIKMSVEGERQRRMSPCDFALQTCMGDSSIIEALLTTWNLKIWNFFKTFIYILFNVQE